MTAEEALLRLDRVTKRYPGAGNAKESPVLDELDLEVRQGERLAILGPSGCGKTTLLNLIGTLDRPDRGSIRFEGQELTTLPPTKLAEVRNRRVGFIFQLHHLLPQCTVLENVLLPTLACRNEVVRDGAPERARRLLKRVGLEARMRHRPGQLSGGERQRAAVVRALINEPTLLLADEPTGALDRAAAEQLAQLLIELNQELGRTLITVTHSLDLAHRMGRILELRDGKLHPVEQSS